LIQNFIGSTAPYSYGTFPYVYVNGVLQTSGYTVNEYGTLTFNTAPTSGYSIAWTGGFQYRCVFESDSWSELAENYYQLWTLENLKFSSYLL